MNVARRKNAFDKPKMDDQGSTMQNEVSFYENAGREKAPALRYEITVRAKKHRSERYLPFDQKV